MRGLGRSSLRTPQICARSIRWFSWTMPFTSRVDGSRWPRSGTASSGSCYGRGRLKPRGSTQGLRGGRSSRSCTSIRISRIGGSGRGLPVRLSVRPAPRASKRCTWKRRRRTPQRDARIQGPGSASTAASFDTRFRCRAEQCPEFPHPVARRRMAPSQSGGREEPFSRHGTNFVSRTSGRISTMTRLWGRSRTKAPRSSSVSQAESV